MLLFFLDNVLYSVLLFFKYVWLIGVVNCMWLFFDFVFFVLLLVNLMMIKVLFVLSLERSSALFLCLFFMFVVLLLES